MASETNGLKITPVKRVFIYNGLQLPDALPERSPAQVKDFYSGMYPELATAEVEGPNRVGTEETYTFKRSAGTKGAQSLQSKGEAMQAPAVPFVERMRALASGKPDPALPIEVASICPSAEMLNAAAVFQRAISLPGAPMPVPRSAIVLML